MKLRLERPDTPGPRATIGKLFVNEAYFCITLEDMDRYLENGGEKVYGQTAIPRGTYDVIVDWSHHFNRPLPHVLNVPQFEGIRIHPGNRPEDTEGCILVGRQQVSDNYINQSRPVFEQLFHRIEQALSAGEKITLEVK